MNGANDNRTVNFLSFSILMSLIQSNCSLVKISQRLLFAVLTVTRQLSTTNIRAQLGWVNGCTVNIIMSLFFYCFPSSRRSLEKKHSSYTNWRHRTTHGTNIVNCIIKTLNDKKQQMINVIMYFISIGFFIIST